jgi:hypothetical protein
MQAPPESLRIVLPEQSVGCNHELAQVVPNLFVPDMFTEQNFVCEYIIFLSQSA